MGVILSILVNKILLKRALQKMDTCIWPPEETYQEDGVSVEISDISISIVSATKAFFNKDKQFASRDMQVGMTFVMPVILPLISLVSIVIMVKSEDSLTSDVLMLTNFWMKEMKKD